MHFNLNFKDQINNFFVEENDVFSVITEEGIEEKKIKQIEIGDLIVGKHKFCENLNNPFEINYNSNTFKYSGFMTNELAEFLGYFVSFYPYLNKNTIIIKNPSSIDFFYNMFKKIFTNDVNFLIYDETLTIETNSDIINFFYYLGVIFEDHCIPYSIRSSSNEYISSFLTGFFKKNINFELNKVYQLNIKDLTYKMICNIQYYLYYFGIYSIAEQIDKMFCLKLGGYSNLKRFIECIKTEHDHKLKIIQNNYFFKTGITSKKLQKLFLKNVPSDLEKNENKMFDIYDIEGFIDFEENIGNCYYNHMKGIFDYPLYCVEKIEYKENTTNDFKKCSYNVTQSLEGVLN